MQPICKMTKCCFAATPAHQLLSKKMSTLCCLLEQQVHDFLLRVGMGFDVALGGGEGGVSSH